MSEITVHKRQFDAKTEFVKGLSFPQPVTTNTNISSFLTGAAT